MFEDNILNKIQQFIENELEKQVQKEFKINEIQHNHPPLRFKVDGCEYCQKFGNVFEVV